MADKNPQKRQTDPNLEALETEFESATTAMGAERREKKAETTERTREQAAEMRADVRRDTLERDILGADKDTAKEIMSIDENKEFEPQREAIRMLNLTCATIVAKAEQMGVDIKEKAPNFRDILALKNYPFIKERFEKQLTPTEKVALNKLLEIANSPGTPLYEYYSSNWNSLLENFSQTSMHARAATEAFEEMGRGTAIGAGALAATAAVAPTTRSKKSAKKEKVKAKKEKAKPEEKSEEGSSVWEKTKTFVKNHPYISLGIAILGAIGIYKIYKKVTSVTSSGEPESQSSEGEKEKKSGFWGKLFGVGILTAAGLFIAGAIAGPGKMKEWWEKFKGAVPGLTTEEQKAQAKILSEKTGKTISAGTIKSIADISYIDYTSWTTELMGGESLEDKAQGLIGLGKSKEQLAEEKAIREYLNDHTSEIAALNLPLDATVFQVLQALHKSAAPAATATEAAAVGGAAAVAAGTAKESQEGRETNPENMDEAVETNDGVVGVDRSGAEQVKREFKDKPKIVGLFDEYNKVGWEKSITGFRVFSARLVEACKQDGVLMCISGTTLLLWTGVKWIATFSWLPLIQAVKDTAQLHFGDAITNYTKSAFPLILIGAGLGAARGLFSSKSTLLESLKGAGRGFIFPVTLTKMTIRAGATIVRTAKQAEFTLKRWTSAKEAVPEILRNEAKFYGEMAEKFNLELEARGSYRATEKAKQLLKSPFRLYSTDRLERLRNSYYEKFQVAYERATGKKLVMFKTEGGIKKPVDDSVTEMRNFLKGEGAEGAAARAALSPEGVAQAFKNHEEILRNPDGTFKSTTDLEARRTTLKSEIDALPDTDPVKKIKMQERDAIEVFLDPKKATAQAVDGTVLSKLTESQRAVKIEQAAMDLESAERSVQARLTRDVQEIKAEAARRGLKMTDPEIMAKLEKVDTDVLIPFAKHKQREIKTLLQQYESLPLKMRSPGVKKQLIRVLEGTESSFTTKLAKGVKGRAKMMVLMASLMFVTDQIIHRNDPDREFTQVMEELGPDFAQLFIDVLPFIGTFSNYYSAFSGKELATTRDVSGTWDRASNVLWGTVGLAGDAITVLGAIPSGGTSIGANVVLRLAKAAKGGSKVAAKALKMWPRIEKIAARMGGWRKFGDRVMKYNKMGKEGSRLIKGLRTIQKVGMVAGTGMLAIGLYVNLRYAFVDEDTEIDIPKDLPVKQAEVPDRQSVREDSPEKEAA